MASVFMVLVLDATGPPVPHLLSRAHGVGSMRTPWHAKPDPPRNVPS